jgi:hypothetical protein
MLVRLLWKYERERGTELAGEKAFIGQHSKIPKNMQMKFTEPFSR